MSRNIVSKHNVGQNIWQKLNKSRKIRQKQKPLPSVLALIWTTIVKKLFLERNGYQAVIPRLKVFLIFPNFLRC